MPTRCFFFPLHPLNRCSSFQAELTEQLRGCRFEIDRLVLKTTRLQDTLATTEQKLEEAAALAKELSETSVSNEDTGPSAGGAAPAAASSEQLQVVNQ